MIGTCPGMQRVFAAIRRVAATGRPVVGLVMLASVNVALAAPVAWNA